MIIDGVSQTSVVDQVVTKWRVLKTSRLIKERKWADIRKAYLFQQDETWDSSDPAQAWRSRRYFPLITQIVENLTASYLQGTMPGDNWFDVLPRTYDDEFRSKRLKALMSWQMDRVRFRTEASKVIKQSVMYGYSPYGVLWDTKWVHVPDLATMAQMKGEMAAQMMGDPEDQGEGLEGIVPMQDELKLTQIPTVPEKEYDGPVLVQHSAFDHVKDREGSGHSYPAQILRFRRDQSYLDWMAQEHIYENVADLATVKFSTEASDAQKRGIDQDYGLADNPDPKCEVLEMWGDFTLQDDQGQKKTYFNHIAVVGNKSTLLRFEPNPNLHGKCPWDVLNLYDDPNEPVGFGAVESILDLNDALQAFFNHGIEISAFTANPCFKAMDDGTNLDNIALAPGAVIPVTNMNNLQPLNTGGDAEVSMRQVGFLMAQMSDMTGANKAFTNENYQKSATEINILSNQESGRNTEMLEHIGNDFIVPVLTKWIQLNQQYMDQAVEVRIVDPNPQMANLDQYGQQMPYQTGNQLLPIPVRVSPEDIVGMYDVIPVGAKAVSNRQQLVQNTINLTNAIVQSPVLSQAIKPTNYLAWAYEQTGVRDAWKFIKSPQEIAYDNWMAQQQAAQSAGQPGQQGGPNQAQPQPGGGGTASMAGVPGNAQPPGNPGAQPSAGGPQQG